ncbi:MAG: DUF2933 domain-containing protein [Actinomycetota bacterium]
MAANQVNRRKVQLAVVGLGAVAIAVGLFEVRLSTVLSLGLLLLCPLMMMSMHGGMGRHGGTKNDDRAPGNQPDTAHSGNGAGPTCHRSVRNQGTDK